MNTRRWRRVAVAGAAAAAIVIGVSAVAWACTANMSGQIWFTRFDPATGSCTSTNVSAGPALGRACSQAKNLVVNDQIRSPNGLYELRAIPITAATGTGTASSLCHNSKLLFGGPFQGVAGANGSTSPLGGWANQQVTLPAEQQSYVVCAATVGAVAAGVETGYWDNSSPHMTFTVTGGTGTNVVP